MVTVCPVAPAVTTTPTILSSNIIQIHLDKWPLKERVINNCFDTVGWVIKNITSAFTKGSLEPLGELA